MPTPIEHRRLDDLTRDCVDVPVHEVGTEALSTTAAHDGMTRPGRVWVDHPHIIGARRCFLPSGCFPDSTSVAAHGLAGASSGTTPRGSTIPAELGGRSTQLS
jgi:hypothetical protein